MWLRWEFNMLKIFNNTTAQYILEQELWEIHRLFWTIISFSLNFLNNFQDIHFSNSFQKMRLTQPNLPSLRGSPKAAQEPAARGGLQGSAPEQEGGIAGEFQDEHPWFYSQSTQCCVACSINIFFFRLSLFLLFPVFNWPVLPSQVKDMDQQYHPAPACGQLFRCSCFRTLAWVAKW